MTRFNLIKFLNKLEQSSDLYAAFLNVI